MVATIRKYSFRLGNGYGWYFIATPGTFSFAKKLAGVLGLKPGRTARLPKFIIIQEGLGRKYLKKLVPDLGRHFPGQGWISQDTKTIKLWHNVRSSDVICELGKASHPGLLVDWITQIVYLLYLQLYNQGCFPLHTALIEKNGKGYLLVATGNTGKSTCCRRVPAPWKALCDDEALIVLGKDNRYRVHPFPTWSVCFKTQCTWGWQTEKSVPLSAIFFLKQAKKDRVIPVKPGQAAWRIYHSAKEAYQRNWMWPKGAGRSFFPQILDSSFKLVRAIPAYILKASLHGRFWEKIEEVKNKIRIDMKS